MTPFRLVRYAWRRICFRAGRAWRWLGIPVERDIPIPSPGGLYPYDAARDGLKR
jgi:hypothetical protein